jgi:hypothetical protein
VNTFEDRWIPWNFQCIGEEKEEQFCPEFQRLRWENKLKSLQRCIKESDSEENSQTT